MAELRQNIVYKQWVIIAKERAKRPEELIEKEGKRLTHELPEYDEKCPFCKGNEEKFPHKESLRIPYVCYLNTEASKSFWQVRVIKNKYPALSETVELVWDTEHPIFRKLSGYGIHEVIIEHPKHNTTLALMAIDEVFYVLKAFKERYMELRENSKIEYIIIFKNHGPRAGASLPHTHSQLLALPIVPKDVMARINEAFKYHEEHGGCIFCKLISEEIEKQERIVAETSNFVAFVLYAATTPFHMWILPKKHSSSFANTTDEELLELAGILREVLAKIYYGLNDPDYNMIIRTSPITYEINPFFHWYITIVPRLTRTAGFELGSGMFINPSIPEEDAKYLREVKIPPLPLLGKM